MAKKVRLTVKYTGEIKHQIASKVAQGFWGKAIADSLGVSLITLQRWLDNDPRFKERLLEVRRVQAHEAIEVGLFELAKGYTQTTEKTEKVVQEVDELGNIINIKKTTTTKINPPDTAAIKLLANKYAKGEYEETKDSRINLGIVKITERNEALTLQDRLKILQQDSSLDTDSILASYRLLKDEFEDDEKV